MTIYPTAFIVACCLAAAITGGVTRTHPEASAKGVTSAKKRAARLHLQDARELLVYAGTYTQRGSKGIYLFHLDLATGKLTPAGLAGAATNPSFLAIHPSHKYLYSVDEVDNFDGSKAGAVSAFAIEPGTGKLLLLNRQSTRGVGPCHLTVDKAGKNVLAANYGGGSICVLPIKPDGKLAPASCFIQHEGSSVNKSRQEGPHAHSMNLDLANRFAFAADLGLDKVFVYRFDGKNGKLMPNDPPFAAISPGSGPRHFAFHPSGKFAYVINEMASTITAFSYNPAKGELTTLQTISTLPSGYRGNTTCAEIVVHPSGKFVYGSNRGRDSIAMYLVDQSTGKLSWLGDTKTGGKTPRNFAVDPTGAYLLAANQDSDNIVVFRIDPSIGKLSPTGHKASVPMPVCIRMMAAGR